jgi:hypothetical protein
VGNLAVDNGTGIGLFSREDIEEFEGDSRCRSWPDTFPLFDSTWLSFGQRMISLLAFSGMTAVTLGLAATCGLSSSASANGLLNLVLFYRYTLTLDVRMHLVFSGTMPGGGPAAGQFHFAGCLGDFDPMDS